MTNGLTYWLINGKRSSPFPRTLNLVRCICVLIACILISGARGAIAEEIRVLDDTGREVMLDAPARRIVSLSPHITELLFELGLGDRVVGTVRFSDYPPQARLIQRVGDAFSLNIEVLMGLAPDLVIAWYTGGSGRSVNKLISLGIPVYFNEAPTLESISASAQKIATLAGEGEKARARGQEYLNFLQRLRAEYQSRTPVKIFYQLSDINLFTVNDDHLIGQAVKLCGGRNVFGASPIKVPEVGKEAVVTARPDLIIFTGSESERNSGNWLASWENFRQVPAVAQGQLHAMSPDMITRPSFRMASGVDQLCKLIDAARPDGS
jgi:iron complex transport system substrate-binding protein